MLAAIRMRSASICAGVRSASPASTARRADNSSSKLKSPDGLSNANERDRITACEPKRKCSASTSRPGSKPSLSRAMPPKPNRSPWWTAAAATLSTMPLASGSNMKRIPREICKSFNPTKTSYKLGVSIQSSRLANAPAVSSNATIGHRPSTICTNSRSDCASMNMGSIKRSASGPVPCVRPCASTASTSLALPSCSGLTRTMSRACRSILLTAPMSSIWWVLIWVLRPA